MYKTVQANMAEGAYVAWYDCRPACILGDKLIERVICDGLFYSV